LNIVADDGRNREEFILDRPDLALYLPPMVWGVQYRFSVNAVLLVLVSVTTIPAITLGNIRVLELARSGRVRPFKFRIKGTRRGAITKGDVVIIWKLDHPARSLRQFIDTTVLLNERALSCIP